MEEEMIVADSVGGPVVVDAQVLIAEIRELKEILREVSGRLSQIQTVVEGQFKSGLAVSESKSKSDFFIDESELIAMANDPEIIAEVAAINREFAVAEMDGLEGL